MLKTVATLGGGGGGGNGTVTSVSVTTAHGFAGTVTDATTTPAISLTTTVTGILKGDGANVSAATSGVDYAPATVGSAILYGNGSGGFSNVTIGTNLSFVGGTLSASGSTGVSDVTATAPVVSSGGSTPNISMHVADSTHDGYLSSTDWNTFNGKGSGTVTSVSGTSPIASSGGTTPAISISQANATTNGYLSSTDWNTFNNKQPAGSYLTAVTADAPLSGSGTSGSHLSIPAANSTTNGYLTSTDWTTFNSKVSMVYPGAGIANSTGTAWGTSYSTSGSGNVALTTSPSFTTPVLGTPTSGDLSACTNIPVSNASGTLTIAHGGTNTTSFTSPSANVAGLVYYSGTALANDGTVTDAGYNTVTNTLVTNNFSVSGTANVATANVTIFTSGNATITGGNVSANLSGSTADGTNNVGYLNIPQNAQTGNYTLVLGDSGKHLYHKAGDAAATYTIPAASSVAYPLGTAVTFVNLSANAVTISITTDTLYLSSAGTTGSRTLSQYGVATAVKVSGVSSSGLWIISGSGLT